MKQRTSVLCFFAIAGFAAACAYCAEESAPPKKGQQFDNAARNYFSSRYANYKPAFLSLQSSWFWCANRSDERSAEKNFDNLSIVNEDHRADAAIGVALKKEEAGQFREAQPLYQDIIEKMPDVLYRVSENGVFVRAADYCQMRLLGMPPADLAFYRTQYDPRAADAFAEAERQGSLAAYQEIADTMLATSCGDKVMLALGRAALDAGNYQEAYDRFNFIKEYFKGGHCDTPDLYVLLAYTARKLGRPLPTIPAGVVSESIRPIREALQNVTPVLEQTFSRSAPFASASDYGACPLPEGAPLLTKPEWTAQLPTEWYTKEVYSRPVITNDSVLLRHRNIIYCYSLLTGLVRWKNDLGGRVVWQNAKMLAFPSEDLVVSENMVYTNVYKNGPSLVALSLTTGELCWAAGPLSAAADAHLRFEAAPVVENGTVYAGYVLDNIEGDTHFDTAYGVRAYDAKNGQLLWDSPISRMAPATVATNVGDFVRNKIRSFSSPPTIRESTLYYSTNAGTIASLDTRTGRIKWLIRYPYYHFRSPIHDATESTNAFSFTSGRGWPFDTHNSLWSAQPPLIYEDCLFVAPVDSTALMAVELASGKVRWSHQKGIDGGHGGHTFLGPGYLVGPTKQGKLIAAYGSRLRCATVLDAATGKVEWEVPDVEPHEASLALTEPRGLLERTLEINQAQFQLAAPPTLLADDTLVMSSFAYFVFGMNVFKAHAYGLAKLSISDKKIIQTEHYYDAAVLSAADRIIHEDAPTQLKFFDGAKADHLKKIMADNVPENTAGAFEAGSMVTVERYGVVFEIRVTAGQIAVAYNRSAVEKRLAGMQTAEALQARAELALANGAYSEAVGYLNECLAKTPAEQAQYREKIAGLFHSLHVHLACKSLLRRDYPEFIRNAGQLLETSVTSAQEIQCLMAEAEGYERTGDPVRAANVLQNVISYFGAREYSISPLSQPRRLDERVNGVLDSVAAQAPVWSYGNETKAALSLAKSSLPLYTSVLSPADKTVSLEIGSFALARLRVLAQSYPDVAKMLQTRANEAFSTQDPAEREVLLRCFPGTAAGQQMLDSLTAAAKETSGLDDRRLAWRIAEVAEEAGFQLPAVLKEARPYAQMRPAETPIKAGKKLEEANFEDPEILRLVMQRSDTSAEARDLFFVAGRARKRLDNKFTLECFDADGKKRWEYPNIRLKGEGHEPGFFETFIHHNAVIVHGLYDVLAFDLSKRDLLWRYRVPSDFEIGKVLLVSDLLILAGDRGTLALNVPANASSAELVWQCKEEGEIYTDPYVVENRLIMVRQNPDGVTVRYLGSGALAGRIGLPGLSSSTEHPLIAAAGQVHTAAHCGNLLMLTDGWDYYLLDTKKLSTLWKREIDHNDPTVIPPMRIVMNDHIAIVTKKDFDKGAMYGIDLATGDLRWRTDPRNGQLTPPLCNVSLTGDAASGLTEYGKGNLRLISFKPDTGEKIAEWKDPENTAGIEARLYEAGDGKNVLLSIVDGKKLRFAAFDGKTAQPVVQLQREGIGPFGVHGCASAAVSNGRLLLLTKNGFTISGGE